MAPPAALIQTPRSPSTVGPRLDLHQLQLMSSNASSRAMSLLHTMQEFCVRECQQYTAIINNAVVNQTPEHS